MDRSKRYDIVLTKGDLCIELSSDDVYFISKEINKWFKILLDERYVVLPPVSVPPLPAAEKAVILPVPLKEAPVENSTPPVENIEPTSPEPPVVQASQPTQESVQNPVETVEETTSTTVTSMPEPMESAEEEVITDDFEAMLETIMDDMNEQDVTESVEITGEFMVSGFSVPELPQEEGEKIDLGLVESFVDLAERSNASEPEAHLMLAAYYLTYFDGEDKFSLKRVNSMMIKSGISPVNHSVLESVVSKGYLSMVPDVTGTADVTEYAITAVGQEYAEQLI